MFILPPFFEQLVIHGKYCKIFLLPVVRDTQLKAKVLVYACTDVAVPYRLNVLDSSTWQK